MILTAIYQILSTGETWNPTDLLNNPASVSMLSGLRKPQIRFKETAIPMVETFIINS